MAQQGTHVTELTVGMRVRRTGETHDGAEVGTVVKVDTWELGTPYAVVEYSDGTQWSGTDYAWTAVEGEATTGELVATLAENGRAVHVRWSGIGAMPSAQAFTGAARAASGGHPVKFRHTAWDTHGPAGTFVYSRRVR